MNISGFRKFKKIMGVQLNFKILLVRLKGEKIENIPIGLQLVLSFPEELFKDSCAGEYKHFQIYEDDWEKISGEEDYSKIENEFRNAVTEFNNVDDYCEYKNKVNLHLIEKAIKFLEKQK